MRRLLHAWNTLATNLMLLAILSLLQPMCEHNREVWKKLNQARDILRAHAVLKFTNPNQPYPGATDCKKIKARIRRRSFPKSEEPQREYTLASKWNDGHSLFWLTRRCQSGEEEGSESFGDRGLCLFAGNVRSALPSLPYNIHNVRFSFLRSALGQDAVDVDRSLSSNEHFAG
jgi:hypothetical protein